MKNKSFAVIGLGQFGMTLAVTLAESDCDVLAIDDKEENIEEISEKVTYAVKADVHEENSYFLQLQRALPDLWPAWLRKYWLPDFRQLR